jgi:hypothetical protein
MKILILSVKFACRLCQKMETSKWCMYALSMCVSQRERGSEDKMSLAGVVPEAYIPTAWGRKRCKPEQQQ